MRFLLDQGLPRSTVKALGDRVIAAGRQLQELWDLLEALL